MAHEQTFTMGALVNELERLPSKKFRLIVKVVSIQKKKMCLEVPSEVFGKISFEIRYFFSMEFS